MSAAEDLSDLESYRADVECLRGYAVALADAAVRARECLETDIDRLVQARLQAEESLERCRAACEYAERVSVFAARAMAGDVDPQTIREAADAIEQLRGAA